MYLDPGIGSMIIQFIIAGIAACGGLLFAFRNKVKSWFARKNGGATPAEASTSQAEDCAPTSKISGDTNSSAGENE